MTSPRRRRPRHNKYMNSSVEAGDRVTVAGYGSPDGTPPPGTITAVGTSIPGVGRWVTIRLDRGYTITVADDKISPLERSSN